MADARKLAARLEKIGQTDAEAVDLGAVAVNAVELYAVEDEDEPEDGTPHAFFADFLAFALLHSPVNKPPLGCGKAVGYGGGAL